MTPSSTASPADQTWRELRIAPVMTGGTSLAIWMGGVTAELYALYRAPLETEEPAPDSTAALYRKLLALTETRPVVDVVTGTSAGGMNGCLLSAAVCLSLPLATFGGLRTTLMTTADLSTLMRDPSVSNPRSLLDAEVKFEGQLLSALQDWTTDHDWTTGRTPVDLVTTYTRVRPVRHGRVDDFGEDLNEVLYAGTLRFDQSDFMAADDLRKLAIAARTSAGIPAVFEASFLPSNGTDAAVSARPDLSANQPVPAQGASRWALDGGLVVNLPLGEAIDRIFAQPADGAVRRVILYVCPTPRTHEPNESDAPGQPPSILAAVKTVIASPRAEGIAGDVDAIRSHNDAVRRQRAMRRSLSSMLATIWPSLGEPTYPGSPSSLFDLYRDRRTDASVATVIDRRREITGAASPEDERLRAQLRQPRYDLLPSTIDALAGADGRPWGWGIAPIEEAASASLGLIGRALQIDAYRRDMADADIAARADRCAALSAAKQSIHAALATTREIRAFDDAYWPPFFDAGAEGDPYPQWPFHSSTELEEELAEGARTLVFENLLDAHEQVAKALWDLGPTFEAVAEAAGATPPGTAPGDDGPQGGSTPGDTAPQPSPRATQAEQLRGEVALLLGGATGVADVQRRLLEHHVVATLLLDDVIPREQMCELMQISWNADNALDPARSSDDKLVGTELARLGAFLKPSWRANDFFWGRMDGAARLAQLLVDPGRLYELGVTQAEVEEALGIQSAELALLDQPDLTDVPAQLPETTAEVVRALQLRIAREELPLIAEAIAESSRRGANEPDEGVFRGKVQHAFGQGGSPTDEQVITLLGLLRIGEESARTEVTSDLMQDAMRRGYGVATQAIGGTNVGLPSGMRNVVRWTLRAVRRPVLRQVTKVLDALPPA